MKKQHWIVILVLMAGVCRADTFTHTQKDLVYHGYATSETQSGKTVVMTTENGPVELNLAHYNIDYNATGRNPIISVLSIDGPIALEHATVAFEKAITEEADKGPLLILIELDTPGGRVDLCKRLCSAITSTRYCKTVAYIKGGENGGAYSAGAAVSLACDEIFIVPEASIGAATMITVNNKGEATDMKRAYGETVGEKFNSAWRGYLASLAEENNRSGALARAMADKDIEVIEVARQSKRLFIEPKAKMAGDTVIRTVSKKGELLTLSANEAVQCGIAAGLAASRQDILSALSLGQPTFAESSRQAEAKDEFEKVLRKFNKLNEQLDLKFKELQAKSRHSALTRSAAVKAFDEIVKNGQYLLKLKRSYPDIPYSEESLIEFINDVKAEQAGIKAIR